MKKLILLMTLIFIPFQAFSEEIVVVDVEFVIKNSNQGKRAIKQMQKLVKKAEKEKVAAQEKLMKARMDMEKRAPVLNEKARMKEARALEKQFMDFQKKTYKDQQTLAEKEMELTDPIVENIRQVISDYSKEKGYDLVVSSTPSLVFFASEKKDITDKILSIYNTKHK